MAKVQITKYVAIDEAIVAELCRERERLQKLRTLWAKESTQECVRAS